MKKNYLLFKTSKTELKNDNISNYYDKHVFPFRKYVLGKTNNVYHLCAERKVIINLSYNLNLEKIVAFLNLIMFIFF